MLVLDSTARLSIEEFRADQLTETLLCIEAEESAQTAEGFDITLEQKQSITIIKAETRIILYGTYDGVRGLKATT